MATITQHGGILTPGNAYTCKVFCHQQGQIGINAFAYYCQRTAGTTMTLGEVASAFSDQMKPSYIARLPDTAVYMGVKVAPLSLLDVALPGIAEDFTVGLAAFDPMPAQVSAILKLKTGFMGRAMRGRVYVPFPSEDDGTSAAGPNAAMIAAIDTLGGNALAFAAVVGTNASFSWQQIVWHKSTHLGSPVLTTKCSELWGTQKRRGGYGKLNPTVIS